MPILLLLTLLLPKSCTRRARAVRDICPVDAGGLGPPNQGSWSGIASTLAKEENPNEQEVQCQSEVERKQGTPVRHQIKGFAEGRHDRATCFPDHRRADPRRRGMAREDAGPYARADSRSRSRDDRRVQMDQAHEPVGRARVVSRWDR